MNIQNIIPARLKSNYDSIRHLPTNYVDKFIEVMAESSKAKEINSVAVSLYVRCKDVDLPKTNNFNNAKALLVKSLIPSEDYCLFFHGGTSTNFNYQDLLLKLSNNNINVLAIEYPGYGANKNMKASFKALNDMADVGWQYLTKDMKVHPNKINIMGYCLGGQIATNLAAKNKCKSVLLIFPITKFKEISEGYIKSKRLETHFPKLLQKLAIKSNILKILVKNKLNSYKNIKNLNCPVYILSSGDDPVTDIKWIDKFVNNLLKKGKDVTYIRNYTRGHKLLEEKVNIISEMLTSVIFKVDKSKIFRGIGLR